MGKPVLGLGYQEKTADLMSVMGQSEFVLDIRGVMVDSLIECFLALDTGRTGFRIPRSCTCIDGSAVDQRLPEEFTKLDR